MHIYIAKCCNTLTLWFGRKPQDQCPWCAQAING